MNSFMRQQIQMASMIQLKMLVNSLHLESMMLITTSDMVLNTTSLIFGQ